jgi:hypothetical protein
LHFAAPIEKEKRKKVVCAQIKNFALINENKSQKNPPFSVLINIAHGQIELIKKSLVSITQSGLPGWILCSLPHNVLSIWHVKSNKSFSNRQ